MRSFHIFFAFIQQPTSRSLEEIAAIKEKHLWDPEVFSFSVQSSPTVSEAALRIRRRCRADNPLEFLNPDFLHVWQLDDLVKAAKLLRPKTPVQSTSTETPVRCGFADEHEMRRVYSMIYDVFRCTFDMNCEISHVYNIYPFR